MNNIEVLAPAGDMLSFETAINCGADAVYLGLSNFNARAKAENFNIDNIRDVVKRAHLHGVKVYVTLNTLVSDSEFAELIKLVDIAYLAKVDAFIIQDIGVAKILKDRYKNIVLHASTQMGINNLYGAKVAERLGFKRIVVSRETTLEDIKLIKENTNLEIEFFVQGALCVAFSGNCYLSSLKHKLSGNRGKCLQLCRLKYDAVCDGKIQRSGYLLSAKDLCLLSNLETLIDVGITSLKIEGRLRRPAYVSQTILSVKNVLNDLKNKDLIKKEEENLKKVFVRGSEYNKEAYLFNKNSNIIDINYNNHTGIKIGVVKNVKPFKDINEILIESKLEIGTDDVLKFYYNSNVLSICVGNVEVLGKNLYKIYSKHKPQLNSDVFRLVDSKNEHDLLPEVKKLDVKLNIFAAEGKPCIAEVSYGNIKYKKESDFVFETAINAGLTEAKLIEQFSKVNETSFKIKNIKVNLFGNLFTSKSNLNKFRNELFEEFEQQIIYENEKEYDLNIDYRVCLNDYLANKFTNDYNIYLINELSELDNYNIESNDLVVLFPIEYLNCENNLNIIERKYNCKVGLKLPAIATQKDLDVIDNLIAKKNIYLFGENIYSLYYLEKGYKVVCGYQINLYNSITANLLSCLGVEACVRSIEQIENGIIANNLHEFVFGKVNLMHFVHCPFKTIFKNNCDNCYANKRLEYSLNGNKYYIYRYKISKCYFYLKDDFLTNKTGKSLIAGFYDLTKI